MADPQVLIIGGGISGLSTAWWLAHQSIAVEVWEARELPGGKIRTTQEGGYLTERAAGLLVNFRDEIDQMIIEAGLGDERRERPNELNRYVIHEGRLTKIPMLLPKLLASPLWSLPAKLRLMGEIAIPRSNQPDESVSSFIRRRLGQEVLDTAIDPFVTGTLASDPDKAEARSVLPRLTTLEQRYGSLTLGMLINRILKRRRANKADTFSFGGGMSQLIQAVSDHSNITLRCGVAVKTVLKEREQWLVQGCDRQGQLQRTVPHVVVSTPAYISAGLVQGIDERLSKLLSEIEYAPVAVLHLGMSRSAIQHPLDGTGFLASRQCGLAFNGNLWMSRLFPERAPLGHTLLTSYLGGAHRPEQIELSDRKLSDTLLEGLTPLLGIKGEPDYFRIDRHFRGLPLYHGAYQARMEQIDTRLGQHPGLYLNANYRDGVSLRERIYQGKCLADRIVAKLAVEQPEKAIDLRLAPAR